MGEDEHPVALVVEDETLLRLYAAGLLEEHGFAVLEAVNAAEALKVLQSRADVRLLFTDVQMPGALDGMELAREVHARWPRVLLAGTTRAPLRPRLPRASRSPCALKTAGNTRHEPSTPIGLTRPLTERDVGDSGEPIQRWLSPDPCFRSCGSTTGRMST
jgi:CheY-like chemotaxis protein